jgi:hypothetical protein
LRGANFQRAKAGQTPRQVILPLLLPTLAALITGDAISRLIFGALGRTAAEPGWSFIYALGSTTAIAGLSATLGAAADGRSRFERVAISLAGATTGALVAFFMEGV